ncbi:MAG TPA: glycoside hydrolase family 127 protein [Phycisphaerales bacterium]|nr:glycoside hydrolase family 127 protein [Phycisphaerales bacterium]
MSLVIAAVGSLVMAAQPADASGYRLEAVPFTSVHVSDGFWSPRLETNRAVTIPFAFEQCEATGRLANFDRAAGAPGEHEGFFFNDSDVYKVIEGAAYSLAIHPDPELDAYLDTLIERIAAAQLPDGYLNTYYTLKEPGKRWTNLRVMHELYCAGHLFEAAVAHHQATGKRTLLDVATRFADHIDATFGPGRLGGTPGHQEIEIGLMRLARHTGEKRYAELARYFLESRGRAEGRAEPLYGPYAQDHEPVARQREAVGHAVRAGYQYAAMADAAAYLGMGDYLPALDALWTDVVSSKMYVTGGLGARRSGEAFGDPYELPNDSAYAETCAAIAGALWAHRMALLHADARYADVLERIIYNAFLAGVSLSGDRFFYPNPLACDGHTNFNQGTPDRAPWFACACCPVNVARFIPSVPGYVYATSKDAVFVNLYMGGTAEMRVRGVPVSITQQTDYPWDGVIRLTVTPERESEFTVMLRFPGWVYDQPVPSDLYAYADEREGVPELMVNNSTTLMSLDRGYIPIRRVWKAGDTIELRLPMPVRRVVADERIESNRGRVALARGPIVYCVEGADNEGHALHLVLPDDAPLSVQPRRDLLGGIVALTAPARVAYYDEATDSVATREHALTAVPYYAWNHRGPGEMAVWVAREAGVVPRPLRPTIASTARASASHTWSSDTVRALNDQAEPKHSNDGSVQRHTWWPRRGSTEWVQYDFPRPATVSAAEVYWFDDTGMGHCRPPRSWRLLYREDGQWKPVEATTPYTAQTDRWNTVEFRPVTTDGLRIEADLQPEFSAGILEWRVR